MVVGEGRRISQASRPPPSARREGGGCIFSGVCARVRACVVWQARAGGRVPRRGDEASRQVCHPVCVSRQIVFIGIKMKRAAVEALMDKCLLTDDELAAYRKQVQEAGSRK